MNTRLIRLHNNLKQLTTRLLKPLAQPTIIDRTRYLTTSSSHVFSRPSYQQLTNNKKNKDDKYYKSTSFLKPAFLIGAGAFAYKFDADDNLSKAKHNSSLLSVDIEAKRLQARTENAETVYKKACEYLVKQDYKNSLEKLIEAADLEYPPAYAWLQSIYAVGYGIAPKDAKKAKDFEKKLEDAKSWLEVEVVKGNIEASFGLAHLYSIKNNSSMAIRCCDEALARHPDHIFLLFKKANVLIKDGFIDDAERIYREVIKLKPDFMLAHRNLGHLLLRKSFQHSDEMQAHYEAVLATGYCDLSVLYNYGYLLIHQGDDKAALSKFSEAIKINPKYAYALNGQGDALENLGRYKEAVEAYKKAIAADEDFIWAMVGYGDALAGLSGRLTDEAKKSYEAAIKKGEILIQKPSDNLQWQYKALGQAHTGLGNYKKAHEYFNKMLEDEKAGDREKLHAYSDLGKVFYCEGDYAAALTAIQQAISISPKYVPAILIRVQIYQQQKNWKDAEADLRSIIARQPDNAKANLMLGQILSMQGHYSQAKIYIEKTLEEDPDNSTAIKEKELLQQKLELVAGRNLPGNAKEFKSEDRQIPSSSASSSSTAGMVSSLSSSSSNLSSQATIISSSQENKQSSSSNFSVPFFSDNRKNNSNQPSTSSSSASKPGPMPMEESPKMVILGR